MKLIRTDEPIIARAFSFLWMHRVYVGRRFFELPPNEQVAALMHEEGHCVHRHTEQRVTCLLFLPFLLSWLCRRQEFEADRYSSQRGHSIALLQILKGDFAGNFFTPSHRERRERITLHHEQIRAAYVTGYFARPGVTGQGV